MEKIAFKKNGVLDFIGCIRVHDVSTTFVAVDNFVERTDTNAVKLNDVDLDMGLGRFLWLRGGKIENVEAQTVLYCYRMCAGDFYPSTGTMLAAIGDEAHAETNLADIYALLSKQPNGEDGILLNARHFFNIFFVRDPVGKLQVVIIHWTGKYWEVATARTDGPNGFGPYHRVFLRHFMVEEPVPTH